MNNKIVIGLYICIIVFILSFVNNIIYNFDDIKLINQEEEITTFYELSDVNVKTKKFQKEKLILKYIIYFIFYYNLDHIEKIKYW